MTRPADIYRATELQCQTAIVKHAIAHGWIVHATRAARTTAGWRTPIQGQAGFPDLVLVHPARQLLTFVELKRKPNKVEPDQQRWHTALTEAGCDVHVWWVPEDLDQIYAWLANTRRHPSPTTTQPGDHP